MDRFIPFSRQNSSDIINKLSAYKHKNGKELGLSGKLAAVLPPGAQPELPPAISSFNNLRVLDVSLNRLRALTPKLALLHGTITELNASHNLLSDVSEVAALTRLQSLDLSYNNVRAPHIVPLTTLVQLKELHLSNNMLATEESPPSSPSDTPPLMFPMSDSAPDTRSPPLPRKASSPVSLLYRHSLPINSTIAAASPPATGNYLRKSTATPPRGPLPPLPPLSLRASTSVISPYVPPGDDYPFSDLKTPPQTPPQTPPASLPSPIATKSETILTPTVPPPLPPKQPNYTPKEPQDASIHPDLLTLQDILIPQAALIPQDTLISQDTPQDTLILQDTLLSPYTPTTPPPQDTPTTQDVPQDLLPTQDVLLQPASQQDEDTSLPVQDSSLSVQDSSGQDSSLSVQDTSLPVQDASLPVQDVSLPVQDASLPVQDVSPPVQDASLPVQDSSFSVQSPLIVQDSSLHVRDSSTPYALDLSSPSQSDDMHAPQLVLTPIQVPDGASSPFPLTPTSFATVTSLTLTLPSTSASPAPSPSSSSSTSPAPSPRATTLPPLSFNLFIHLEVLTLSSNDLPVFPDVHALVSLVKLDLSFNKIVEVPTGIATQLTSLKELNLQSNLIEKLPPMMKSLKKLLVEQNPLHHAFSMLSTNGDLLSQLQATPDNDVVMPRSSSDGSLVSAAHIAALQASTPPALSRSATPPPNSFLSRIFRKDLSFSDNSPKGKNQSRSGLSNSQASQEDPTEALVPVGPTNAKSPEMAKSPNGTATEAKANGKHANGKDSEVLSASSVGVVPPAPPTPTLTKKRSLSLPQPYSARALLTTAASFGIPPPASLSFSATFSSQRSPTEVYDEFVRKLTQTRNIKSSIDSFVTRIKSRSLDVDDLQAALQDFVRNTHTTLAAHPLWRNCTSPELQEAELSLQEYVLEHLYENIFGSRNEDKVRDKEISQHIKRCYFVTPEHLDITIMREHEDIWRKAEMQLLQINSTRSVRSKMRCVVRTCRDLITSLARAHGDNLGADVLLPHLIVVLIHANPPHLHSNIVYMTRFSESEDSETIYYVTQLVAALYFVEHLEASSLNMDPDEFHQRMYERPTPARPALPRSGSNTLSTSTASMDAEYFYESKTNSDVDSALDTPNLVRAISSKRKEFAALGEDTSNWVTENDSLINQCVAFSKEALPSLTPSSSAYPLVNPTLRFEGVIMEDLRAVEIPQLLEDYHRIAALLRLHLPSTHSHSHSHSHSNSNSHSHSHSHSHSLVASSAALHLPSTPTPPSED